MKKMPLLFFSALLSVSAYAAPTTPSSSAIGWRTQALRFWIQSGWVDAALVQHNLSVYENLLDGISASKQKEISLAKIDDLKSRVERQIGFLPSSLVFFGDEAFADLQKARDAATRGNLSMVRHLAEHAKRELIEIQSNLPQKGGRS